MVLFACEPGVETYTANKPKLDLREFFSGNLEGHGILQDWRGKMTRRFTFTMKGSVKNDVITLNEVFLFDDGEKQSREWNIAVTRDHFLKGKASDGVGDAQGEQYGNAANLRYVLRVPTKGSTYDLSFDDWMFLQENGEVMNVTTLRKFGFKVASLSIVIRKK